jgi:hypothetical protein
MNRWIESLPDRLKPVGELVVNYYAGADLPYDYGNQERLAGGNLHIVLDDGAWERRSILFCLDQARTYGDWAGYYLGLILLHLSDEDRQLICIPW